MTAVREGRITLHEVHVTRECSKTSCECDNVTNKNDANLSQNHFRLFKIQWPGPGDSQGGFKQSATSKLRSQGCNHLATVVVEG